jgi:hypothetical protein
VLQPDAVSAGISFVRAEEAWEPVLFGGMIPIAGALGILFLIRWAIKEPPEDEETGGEEKPPPAVLDDDGHEGPLS